MTHDYRYRMHVIERDLYSVSLGDNDFPRWLVLFSQKNTVVSFSIQHYVRSYSILIFTNNRLWIIKSGIMIASLSSATLSQLYTYMEDLCGINKP
jgi:hypothetical protein